MKLNEVIQTKTELEIEKLDRPLIFNNVTLADQAWLDDNYPKDELIKIFTEGRHHDILKVAVRFLDDKSKDYLSKVQVVERDEYGEVKDNGKKHTLAEKLFFICSDSEFVLLIKKLFEIKNKSTSLINKMSSEFEKKKENEEKVGNP